MVRRLLAVVAGGLVAYGVYSFVTPAPPPAARATASLAANSTLGNLVAPATNESGTSPSVNPVPVRLVIPEIAVDAKIEARGLDANRNLAAAADYRDVAWYELGPRPGEPGDAILNGHVNWWTGDAVFIRLGRLRPGDPITVVRADGARVNFKVSGLRTVDANARLANLFATSGRATLTLITCTGLWNPATQSDTERLLVTAVLA